SGRRAARRRPEPPAVRRTPVGGARRTPGPVAPASGGPAIPAGRRGSRRTNGSRRAGAGPDGPTGPGGPAGQRERRRSTATYEPGCFLAAFFISVSTAITSRGSVNLRAVETATPTEMVTRFGRCTLPRRS